MIHNNASMESDIRRNSIDIRACACGSIHISFFGRTTFHLSREEFLDFSKGVSRVRKQLSGSPDEGDFSFIQSNGFSH